MPNHKHLTEVNQSWWQLSVIQLAGWMGLPTIATSILVLQENSFWGAVLTLIVGNAILWFIRLGIVTMSYKHRQSTLDISKDYLGNMGSYFIASLLLISTLIWFIVETYSGSSTLTKLITIQENPEINQFAQVSVLIGIVSTFLCMNGIVMLRKLATVIFPFVAAAFFVILFSLPDYSIKDGTEALSLSGLTIVLATNLGITSDIPTFFRHSQSLQTSVRALTIIQIITLFIGICGLYFGAIINHNVEINESVILGANSDVLRYALILFVSLSVVCTNVANVYSASVGWELLAPKQLVGRKEYLILGLGLTAIFILITNLFSLDLSLEIADSSLVNLCIVLIIGYIIARQQKRLPNLYLQTTYFIAWLSSSIVNLVDVTKPDLLAISPVVVSTFVILGVISASYMWKKRSY